MAIWDSVIGAGANLVGGMLSGFGAARAAKIQNRGNMDLAKYGYEQDLAQWHRSNQYNSPAEQMKRLEAAGLNPNLVYGSGSVVGNTSSGNPQFKSPSYQAVSPLEKIGPALGMLSQFQDFQVKNAQINNLRAQGELINNQAITEALNPEKIRAGIGLTKSQTSKTDEEALYVDSRRQLNENTLSAEQQYADDVGSNIVGQFQLDQKKAMLRNLQLDQTLKQVQKGQILSVTELNDRRRLNVDADTALKKYESRLNEVGLSKGDNVLFRVFDSLMNELFNYFTKSKR